MLAVTGYGVAEDLGLVGNPPTQARARPGGQAPPSRAAIADIPPGYRRLYLLAARRCPGLSWAVLAAIGKVESDHGRARLPGVRSGWNRAGAAGPMQFGIGVGRAGNAWARYGGDFDRDGDSASMTRATRSRPPPATCATTAPPAGWRPPSTPTTTPGRM